MVGPGIAYALSGTILVTALVAWLRRGRSAATSFVDYCYQSAESAGPLARGFLYFAWTAPRLVDPSRRERRALFCWASIASFGTVLTVLMFVAAVAEFRR